MSIKFLTDFTYSLVCYLKTIKKAVKKNIPYFSQRESPQLVDDILKKRILAREDPQWARSGAASPEEYEYWCCHICGMACLKMVLADFLSKEYKTIELAKKAAFYKAYIPKRNTIDGLFYAPFCLFLAKEFDIDSDYYTFMTQKVIKYELNKNNYVIASVNQKIREGGKNISKNKNGHLVLITGYDEAIKVFYIHNPSGYYKQSQINQSLSYDEFGSFFGHRGIVIYKTRTKNTMEQALAKLEKEGLRFWLNL